MSKKDNLEEQYRHKNDTEREWQLRKLFIEKFQNDFEHDRLLCLAQCYVNIQTMGCRYSDKIMQQIKSLTADFEPLLKARIESINNEMREKNSTNKKFNHQNYNNNNNNGTNQQGPKQQQSTTATYANRQKLLSKTPYYENQPSNVKSPNQTPNSKPIQILSRTKTNEKNLNEHYNQPQQQGAFSPQKNSSTPLSKKYSSSPNTSNLLGKSASGVGSSLTPSVPSGTTELAPAASQVPIPFGLSSASESAMPAFKPDYGRNALLNQLAGTQTPSTKPTDPFAILMGNLTSTCQQATTSSDDKFLKLNKINKLRDVLRNTNVQFDDNFDVIDFFDDLCRRNGINLTYVQYEQKDVNNGGYYGELFVETFRLVTETNKKRKKCKYACYKSAVQILKSKSELAVKLSTGEKRDPTYTKSNAGQNQSNDVDFEYELYRTDSNSGMFVDSSNNVITNFLNGQCQQPQPAPQPQQQQQFNSQQPVVSNETSLSLSSLNSMLKSLILPKDKSVDNVSRNQSVLTSTQHDDSKETQQLDQDDHDDNDDDDDDEDKSQTSDKKSRVKQNLVNFCLYIPCTFEVEINANTLDKFVHDKNSINILHNSCIKSKCNLEFELKTKTVNSSKPTKTIISGDRIQSESDDESSSDLKKLKCRCLINGMRISSVHAKNRADAKRQAALKAIKYLFKLFPAMKETNYHSLANNPSSQTNTNNNDMLAKLFGSPSGTCAAQAAPKYFKITKEELFSGLVPPSMFEQCSSLPNNQPQSQQQPPQLMIPFNNLISIPSTHTQTNSQFGFKMLKKMGWKGEGYGLGKTQQGITKPVEFDDLNRTRFGFGYDEYQDELEAIPQQQQQQQNSISNIHITDTIPGNVNQTTNMTKNAAANNNASNFVRKPRINDLLKNIRQVLIHFANSPTDEDLIFDRNLTTDDRKLIHREAHRLGLKTRSEGSAENRFIVVRKKLTSSQIIESAMKNGGQISRYQIISKAEEDRP